MNQRLLESSQSHPTVETATKAKYLITCLSKF